MSAEARLKFFVVTLYQNNTNVCLHVYIGGYSLTQARYYSRLNLFSIDNVYVLCTIMSESHIGHSHNKN